MEENHRHPNLEVTLMDGDASWDAARAQSIVLSHRAALAERDEPNTHPVKLLKVTPHRSMSLVQLPEAVEGRQTEVFVKHFHPTELYKKLRQRWRGQSNARLIAAVGREFAARGLRIPTIYALVEAGRESFLLTGSVAHLSSVEDLLRDLSQEPPGFCRRKRKSAVIAALAFEWKRLHAVGIHYAESHTRHVFPDGDREEYFARPPEEWDFLWIDYDGTQFCDGPTPRRHVLKHLFNLSRDYRRKPRLRGIVSRTDMLRFLYFYLSEKSLDGKTLDGKTLAGASTRSKRDEVRQLARAVLAWQPDKPARLSSSLRDAVRYAFRPSERATKQQKRVNRERKRRLAAQSAEQQSVSNNQSD